jgi:hypothetical protein
VHHTQMAYQHKRELESWGRFTSHGHLLGAREGSDHSTEYRMQHESVGLSQATSFVVLALLLVRDTTSTFACSAFALASQEYVPVPALLLPARPHVSGLAPITS